MLEESGLPAPSVDPAARPVRRAQTLDEIHVRTVDLAKKLPRVRGERLDVASLALGEDGVKGKGRFARTGETGEDDQGIPRNIQVDVSQIVHACTANAELRAGLYR